MSLKTFKIPSPAFKFSSEIEGLKHIADLQYAQVTGGKVIGYEELNVVDNDLTGLTPPNGAVIALIVCEADDTYADDKSKLIRYRQFDAVNNPPSATVGMPLGELGVLEVKDFENLTAFRAIGIQAGYVHKLKVEYYG